MIKRAVIISLYKEDARYMFFHEIIGIFFLKYSYSKIMPKSSLQTNSIKAISSSDENNDKKITIASVNDTTYSTSFSISADNITSGTLNKDRIPLQYIVNFIYPVGTILCIDDNDHSNWPSNRFSDFQTWVTIQGRMLIGDDSNDTDFNIGMTGGTKSTTLEDNDIPYFEYLSPTGTGVSTSQRSQDVEFGTKSIGSSFNSHTNMPPYKVVKMQKRSA